jgi:hypothetical protein
MRLGPAVFSLCLAVLPLSGCGSTAPKTYEVSGSVTSDGAPIEDSGSIIAGKYRFQARPGKKSVRIYASRETGEIDPVMRQAKQESYIPEAYNVRTTLDADAQPGGKNQCDFSLTGK